MRIRPSGALAVTAVLAAFAAGCGSGDDDQAGGARTTAADSSKSSTSKLVGSYARTLTSADIERTDRRRTEGPHQDKPKPGPLELTLTDGTLQMTDRQAKVAILQDFSAISDGALRIGAYQRPEVGSFCGPEVQQTASYTWKLAHDVLTLKAKQNECADRDSVLSGDWKER